MFTNILATSSGIPEAIDAAYSFNIDVFIVAVIVAAIFLVVIFKNILEQYDDVGCLGVIGFVIFVIPIITILIVFLLYMFGSLMKEVIQAESDNDKLDVIVAENLQENIDFKEVEILEKEKEDERFEVTVQGKTSDNRIIEVKASYDEDIDIMLPIEDYNSATDIPLIEGSALDEATQED